MTAVLGSSKLRGFAALGLGLAIGLVGMDPVSGQGRLTFGQPLLVDGLDIVVVAVAIFAIGEALWIAAHLRKTRMHTIPVGQPWMGKADWKRSWKPWLRGTAFGFPFGALPAGGAEIPTFLSYVTEKKLSKHPEEFGHGAIEGVAGPEAANNASAAGTLTPMLALGLPTNATAAVMLLALMQFGIQPGPLLFEEEPKLVWALIASLFIGNALLLLINLPMAPLWAKLLQLPRQYLYAGILFFATLGAYAVNLQAFDLVLLLVLGVLGFAMRRFGIPVLPLILGVILGPRAEAQLRKSLQLSAGDPAGLFSEPVAIVAYVIIALVVLWPLVAKLLRRLFPKAAAELEELVEPESAEAADATAMVPTPGAGGSETDVPVPDAPDAESADAGVRSPRRGGRPRRLGTARERSDVVRVCLPSRRQTRTTSVYPPWQPSWGRWSGGRSADWLIGPARQQAT